MQHRSSPSSWFLTVAFVAGLSVLGVAGSQPAVGQVSPAHEAVDRHATRRLRQWLCRKHQVRTGKEVRFPAMRLWSDYGLTRLPSRTASFIYQER